MSFKANPSLVRQLMDMGYSRNCSTRVGTKMSLVFKFGMKYGWRITFSTYYPVRDVSINMCPYLAERRVSIARKPYLGSN